MNQIKSHLNLSFLPSPRFAIAGRRTTQTIFLATLALCAAIYTATPAYGSSSKASADAASKSQDWKLGVVIPDGQANVAAFTSDVSDVNSDVTFTYKKVRPGVTYELTNSVWYIASTCKDVAPGSWSGTVPTYGKVTQGNVHGRLANGDCPGKTFTSRAIFYEWTHDKNAKQDHFSAHNSYDGHSTPTIKFVLDLDY